MTPAKGQDAYRDLAELQFRNLGEDVQELKARLAKLETLVTRGLLLLVANLVALVMSLLQQLAGG